MIFDIRRYIDIDIRDRHMRISNNNISTFNNPYFDISTETRLTFPRNIICCHFISLLIKFNRESTSLGTCYPETGNEFVDAYIYRDSSEGSLNPSAV